MRQSIVALAAGAFALAASAVAAVVVAAAPAGAATPSCTGAQLQVFHSGTQGATGHGNVVLQFKNVGSHVCTLRGYPGVDALGPHGGVIVHARRTLNGFTGGATAVRTLFVSPAHYASADLEWMNFSANGGSCRTSYSLAITPPNTFRTVYRRLAISTCNLQIHPVVYGLSGNS